MRCGFFRCVPRRFDIPYLKRIKSIFTRRARALERRRARHQEAA